MGCSTFIPGNLFSEGIKPTPVPAHIRRPEYYSADHSRPPTPNFAEYPIRVDELLYTIQKTMPVFQFLQNALLQITSSYLLKKKETDLKRLQTPNLEQKFEVKVKFQGINPHPLLHVAKIEHKTTRALFEIVHIDLERDPNLPTLPYGKIIFYNPYSGLKYTTSF